MKRRDAYTDWKENVSDRRRWKRFSPTPGTVAWLDGRSFRMLDISLGGLSIFDYGPETVPEETVVGLHCFEAGFFLDAMRCRKVSDQRMETYHERGKVVINRIGLEIVDNDPELENKLLPFIKGNP